MAFRPLMKCTPMSLDEQTYTEMGATVGALAVLTRYQLSLLARENYNIPIGRRQ